MDTEPSPGSAWTPQRALDTQQRVYLLHITFNYHHSLKSGRGFINGDMASYMCMCWEQGGDGAASGSRLKRRLRLGQRGDGMGLSVRAKRDRRGLLGGPGGLGSVSPPAVPSEKAAVGWTILDTEDRQDIYNQLF